MELNTKRKLPYNVIKSSSSSGTFLPECILEDKPSEQSSRWSSETNTPPQYLLLRLEQPAIVSHITFGKYEKAHVCNLKRFKIYGGNDEDNLIELLDSGLKNDSVSESFRLRYTVRGHFFPFRFIKIVPIQSWGPSYNFSIWYVGLEGDDSHQLVKSSEQWHQQYRERETIRLCLKHFRQQNYTEVFESLQKKTRIQLEDPLLTELHEALVKRGDYLEAEQIILRAIDGGLFEDWINTLEPVPEWHPLILPEDILTDENSTLSPVQTPLATPDNLTPEDENPAAPMASLQHQDNNSNNNNVSASGDSSLSEGPSIPTRYDSLTGSPTGPVIPLPTQPGNRGGHQMVIDSANQTIYLFGGWDGNRDLSDFWAYDITSEKWKLLSMDTEADGGPSPRSCHKMVLDSSCKHIFILGRYLERSMRDRAQNIKSDFYLYDIDSSRWTLVTDDTSAMGGPSLVFDHQMCVDQETRTIYVFGGQSLLNNSADSSPIAAAIAAGEKTYSGLFEYHIPTNTWRKRRDDIGSGASPDKELKSRSSHSMLFHQGQRKLFIFGGQRKRDEYLNDFFSYNVDTDEVEIISTGTSPESIIPAVGHTQRATIDFDRSEIHVMTGLNKDKDKGDKSRESRVSNSFWVYNIVTNKWTCFYRNDNNSPQYWNTMQTQEPRPRYAHQLVYDEINRTHYMFGGNPGGKQGKEDRVRLGDFWRLNLLRPNRREVLRKCQVYIRKSRFCELAQDDPMSALNYLHTELASVIKHDDANEEKKYQRLASQLFQYPGGKDRTEENSAKHQLRTDLFDLLASHFPEEMTHPRGNLIDMIPYPMDLN